MPLTDTAIRNAKPREKAYKLFDGDGLFLLISPAGSKAWRLKYRLDGKEKLLALGVYPTVPLVEARKRREEARAGIARGIDPVQAKKAEKRRRSEHHANTFEAVAREWHETQVPRWSTSYGEKVLAGLEKHVFPAIGDRPITELNGPDLLRFLKPLQKEGKVDRANRLRQNCSEVFRYAIACDRAERNPAADIVRALQTHKQTHYAALSKDELPAFLKALDANHAKLQPTTRLGLKLLALTFVRPGELRQAEWSEFNLDAGEWIIPAHRMKMRQEHIVPLSPQAMDVLHELQAITGQYALLLPSRSNIRRPISDNTFRKALHDMGFIVTAHGFRATASTILNETGFRHDVIERQLSHGDRDKIRAAYNRAQYLEERRQLMVWWGTYLEGLATGSNVVVGRFVREA